MGPCYTHLNIEERCHIARLRTEGHSVRQIAASLDRTPSTLTRELKRHGSKTHGYQPRYADQQARARRWRGSKLERDAALRHRLLACLKLGWSPQQVAGRLARQATKCLISYETIYRFIYAQLARKNDYAWRHYLPFAKSKRGRRRRKGRSPASFIKLRRPLAERPTEVAERRTPGHWEADLMLFRTYGQAILTLHERQSRLLIAARPPGKAAAPIAKAMRGLLGSLPSEWRQTVTFDNGTEFARHYKLHDLGIETFFCDTHAPWQKGGVENAIGRMRRSLPRKTDLALLPEKRFTERVQAYNNTPRKCLGYQTPAETFWKHVLHLKCESTAVIQYETTISSVFSDYTVCDVLQPDVCSWTLRVWTLYQRGFRGANRFLGRCENRRFRRLMITERHRCRFLRTSRAVVFMFWNRSATVRPSWDCCCGEGLSEETYMDNKLTAAGQKSWKVYLGFALLLGSVLASFAQNVEAGEASRIVVTRESLHSFSTGSGCMSVPYTGLQDGKFFIVAEAFVRMELWTVEGLRMPLKERKRLIDSQIYFLQGNAYADWSPKAQPEGVCPELQERLKAFPKELEGMLGLVHNSPAQLDPPCEPAVALMVNGNRVVQSYEFVTDCGLR